jgi:hypothetical protein
MVQQPTMDVELGMGFQVSTYNRCKIWSNAWTYDGSKTWHGLQPTMDMEHGMHHKPTMDDNLWGFKPTLHF